MWQSVRSLCIGIAAISLFSVVFFAELAVASEKKLVISRFKNADGDKVVSYVLEQIYKRIGYEITFVDFPGKTSVIKANAGEADGENMRRAGLESVYSNLVQLSYPHVDINFRLYIKGDEGFLPAADSWKNTRIGIVKGVIVAEEMTKGLNPVLHDSVGDLFKQLNLGKIDVAIATDLIGGLEVFMNHQRENIKAHGETLKTISLYHYLHKKNEHLVPILNKEIELLRKNGELQKLYVEGFKFVRAQTDDNE
ncbi:substrate-binding periplasmic protein [Kiloniella majae]|uniref:substrate-binding periplasmic protein n=1 Tax=Kiloniella majae TaxID=1938558 RepID=UPI000A27893D|nr:transporter substrate-binding domain-containing protein [Kiloniella majae]